MDWTDRVVLITGASSGIGRSLALELARRGAKLGLLARGVASPEDSSLAPDSTRPAPSPRLQAIADEIEREAGHKGAVVMLPADVRDHRAVRAAADELRKQFGHIDVLIANAGITAVTDAAELDPEQFANVLDVNLLGAVNSVAAVLPEMIERGSGQLVAISSLAAYRGHRKAAAYSASKASLSSFFESVRIDLIGRGVDVTIIHPGFIKTPLTAGRKAWLPFIMEADRAAIKIINAIEKRKKSYAFPWQLATYVRAGMIMPSFLYDRLSNRESFKE
jgi:NAD(P)-dependent dehydrogenase (short-subunit alcohol dehydrogenase family)